MAFTSLSTTWPLCRSRTCSRKTGVSAAMSSASSMRTENPECAGVLVLLSPAFGSFIADFRKTKDAYLSIGAAWLYCRHAKNAPHHFSVDQFLLTQTMHHARAFFRFFLSGIAHAAKQQLAL